MVPLPIREAYLNRLTDNGHRFFSLLLSEAFNARLSDGMTIFQSAENPVYHFGFDTLRQQWFGHPEGIPPMFMLEFVSYHHECSFDEAFAFIRRQFIPLAVQSIGWPSAIELAQHKVSDGITEREAKIERAGQLLREELDKSWSEYEQDLQAPANIKYETTPADALHFYFRPGKKEESIFWTATMVVKFMQAQHPGFWTLSEEETGRLLNSERFVICKGRQKGARGYFLNYRDGFIPGVYMELKEAG
jgi:hypothetical protein